MSTTVLQPRVDADRRSPAAGLAWHLWMQARRVALGTAGYVAFLAGIGAYPGFHEQARTGSLYLRDHPTLHSVPCGDRVVHRHGRRSCLHRVTRIRRTCWSFRCARVFL